MKRFRARCGKPKEVQPNSFDGIRLRFPITVIQLSDKSTNRVGSLSIPAWITVEAAGSVIDPWKLSLPDLYKVLFQYAIEFLDAKLKAGEALARDLEYQVKRVYPCPFDPDKIVEPNGAVLELEVNARIGFPPVLPNTGAMGA